MLGAVLESPGCEKNVYWSASDISAGKWIVMPNLRIARLHHVSDSGRNVFITTNGKLVCEHGECASSIGSWVSTEQAALLAGDEQPSRHSPCDCSNTDGMHWTKAMPQALVCLDPPANSLYDMLGALGTCTVMVRGRALRHVPHTCSTSALFVSPKGGMLCCRHGHSLNVLKNIQKGTPTKFRGGVCSCNVKRPPRRVLGFKQTKTL